ncbi:unnamed protein product [Linum trigynum]|uniref:Uncharacterized protein n=1 Tax=Linum trigynum TaxID=586398 RepID=A0AAV2F1V3_9ROSI
MAEPSPSPPPPGSTTITDLSVDSLAHCANYLTLHDLSNFSISCKYLNGVAHSDSVWQRLFREQWPHVVRPNLSDNSRVREAYLARKAAVRQFRFADPLVADFYTEAKPFDHILLDEDDIIYSQGNVIQMMGISSLLRGRDSITRLSDHGARITCMRVFSLDLRSAAQRKQRVLVTSSCDHSIRVWWKGSCQRCLRGHNGPVSCLTDRFLGDGSSTVLVSGGEDCTVRLWSLGSSGKRGQHALKATLYGHEKPIKQMSVAEHNSSLLVSISKDSKVRLWDTTTSSAARSSCCLGMVSVPGGAPVDMKCNESLLYVASGSSVVTIDLRTLRKVATPAICQPNLLSFAMVPSKPLICTGGMGKSLIWDIRRNQETLKPQPVVELEGHNGPVTKLHADRYKIVTGGPHDRFIHVWEAGTGTRTNSVVCSDHEDAEETSSGCLGMAVDRARIATATTGEGHGLIRYRDFFDATCPVSRVDDHDENSSKFWDQQSYGDSSGDVDGAVLK